MKPIMAHMNPKEVQELIQIQQMVTGEPPKFTIGGVPDFTALDEVFAHPEVSNFTQQHMRKNMAAGGHAIRDDFDLMRKSGRYGDTVMAILPTSLANNLDQAIGGRSVNPVTGKREYFIGAVLGGLASLLPSMLPSLGRMLPSMLGSGAGATLGRAAMGSGMGGMMGRAAMGSGSNMFSGLMNTLSNPNVGQAIQNVGGIAQLAAPLFSMFGSGQQQQPSMQMQQYPQTGYSNYYQQSYQPQNYARGGYHDDVMMDLGNPGYAPQMQMPGNQQYYGMAYNGQRMNPSQYSNYASTVPYRQDAYAQTQQPRYLR